MISDCRTKGDVRLPADLGKSLQAQVGRLDRDSSGKAGEQMAGGLTVREVEVLRLVVEGRDTTTIAAELSYSERTIKKVIFDVKDRLELRNRAHVAAYAIRHGYF